LGTEWERNLLKLLCRWEFNMKIDFKEINSDGVAGFICFKSVHKQAVVTFLGP
jgi:hypothetical protein